MSAAEPSTPDPVLVDAMARLTVEDPDAAAAAADALDWMVGAAGLAALNQAGLQQFVWYELPFKWLGGPSRHLAVAAALARFFDLAGLDRYAAVCRSPVTDEVVTAFAVDAPTGFDRFQAAHAASGVVPPDVDDLQWGDLMGPVEFDAFWSSAVTLELAVEAGTVPRTGRSAPGARQALVSAHLTRARPERFGETLLQEIETERIAAWYDDPLERARAQLLEPVVGEILTSSPPPAGAARALRPLRRLLSAAADGTARLTATGRLAPGVALHVVGRTGAARREDEVPGVADLRRLVLARRLARRSGRRLVATRRGVAATESTEALWREAAGHLAGGGAGADPVVAELVVALLLADRSEPTIRSLVRPVQIVLAEDARRGGGGRPPPDEEVAAQVEAVVGLARALGAVRASHRLDRDEPVRLTAVGPDLLRAALRSRAVAPRRRPR
ncbi:MAG: hypothetical protein R2726_05295 [Acidimicrobiales bacterium]